MESCSNRICSYYKNLSTIFEQRSDIYARNRQLGGVELILTTQTDFFQLKKFKIVMVAVEVTILRPVYYNIVKSILKRCFRSQTALLFTDLV